MYECQNCEREFEEPGYINNEKVCPHCYSGDIIEDNIILMQSDELEKLRCVIRTVRDYIKENSYKVEDVSYFTMDANPNELLNMIGDE